MFKKMTTMAMLGVLILALSAGAALAAGITCSGGPCVGTSADDVIDGSEVRDRINARGGDDNADGRAGSDEVVGDAGNDTLLGDGANTGDTDGNDSVFGQLGNDRLGGRGGSDLLDGGFGFDTIDARELNPASTGVDTVRGDIGGDTIRAVDGKRDNIDCGAGTDDVFFDAGVDVVSSNCEGKHPS
jgi:Ca2+-binding RTX toxin-like protein